VNVKHELRDGEDNFCSACKASTDSRYGASAAFMKITFRIASLKWRSKERLVYKDHDEGHKRSEIENFNRQKIYIDGYHIVVFQMDESQQGFWGWTWLK